MTPAVLAAAVPGIAGLVILAGLVWHAGRRPKVERRFGQLSDAALNDYDLAWLRERDPVA